MLVKTKSMEYNDAERFLSSQIPLWARMIEDGAFGPLYDSMTEAVSDIGLRDAEQYISNNIGNIRSLIPRRIIDDWEAFLNTRSGVGADLLNRLSRQIQQDFRNRMGIKSFDLKLAASMAKDGAWGPLEDYMKENIDYDFFARHPAAESPDDVVRRYIEMAKRGPTETGNYNLNLFRLAFTKGLTANDAQQIIRAKEPLLIQIAESGAWYALQDQLDDIIDELGLNGFCNPKSGADLIRMELERYRVTATQAVQRYSEYLEENTERLGTKSLKVKTKAMSKAEAIVDIADMLDMDPPVGLVQHLRNETQSSDRLEKAVDNLANSIINGHLNVAGMALENCASYYGMPASYFFTEAHRQLQQLLG